MITREQHILVIGGGATGLSLARHMINYGSSRTNLTILESRSDYNNDRSWCFWDTGDVATHRLQDMISNRWDNWSFSHGQQQVTHTSSKYPYCFIPASGFYDSVVSQIERSGDMELHRNCSVTGIDENLQGVEVATNKGKFKGDYVIDTRPPDRDHLLNARMYQIFIGYEIEASEPVFDPRTVGLMGNLNVSRKGIGFTYTLPFALNRALIEYTVFSRCLYSPAYLEGFLQQAIRKRLNVVDYRIKRREQAVLPMGLSPRTSSSRRVIPAGVSAGAVRPSSGYAFLRINRWVMETARLLAIGKPPQPYWISFGEKFLDHTFLNVLSNNPAMGPDLFMRMARALHPDAFARFMTDKPSLRDLFALIASMPAKPFLQSVMGFTRASAAQSHPYHVSLNRI